MKLNDDSLHRRRDVAIAARRALGCAMFAIAPVLAYAQDAGSGERQDVAYEDLETIVTTGSRIRGIAPVGSTMVAVGREDIDVSPAISTVDLLREVPQVINLGNDATHRGAQGGNANVRFASGINLRGIGPNATLLLVDGQRMPLGGGQVHFVDPNVIPTIALERMEVIADGASAVYGSDAVAGVVNMILRSDYIGAESSVRFGVADSYDKRQIGQLFGFGWDSGNLMLAYENSYNTSLYGADRDWYSSDQRDHGGGDYRSTFCSPGTLVVGGVRYALPSGDGTSVDPSALTPNTQNRCDDIRETDLIPRSDRHSFALKASQQITDRIRFNTMGFYSERDYAIRGYLNQSRATGSLTVPNTNAFFVSPVPDATSVTVTYLFPEAFGPSINEGTSTSYMAVAGFTADLFSDWQVSLNGSYGESEDITYSTNSIHQTELRAALASSDPATAFNPFGDGTGMSPSVIDRVRTRFLNDVDHRLSTVSLEGNGSLFDLPAGTVRLAIGVEHREESFAQDGVRPGSAVAVADFSREIDSAYSELYVPLVSGAPLADELNLSLAIRYDKYDDFGSTTNPKFGVNWRPTSNLLLTGSYGTSFRAPSLSEVHAEASIYQRVLADPLSPTGQSTGLSVAGGNTSLDPEEATTRSFGVEWEPYALPGLRANVTYFDVEYTGQIFDLHGTPSRLADPAYSAFVTRNPTQEQIQALLATGWRHGDIINPALVTFIIDGRRQNMSETRASGIDYQLRFSSDTNVGQLAFGVFGSYFTRFEIAQSALAPYRSVRDYIDNPLRSRVRGMAAWASNGFHANAFINHSNSYTNNLVAEPERVSSWTTVDLDVGYSFERTDSLLDGVRVSLSVENAFDKQPPYVNNEDGFDPQIASAIGRLVSLSLRKNW